MKRITAENFESAEEYRENGVPRVVLRGVKNFIPADIFECGQCFRFAPAEKGGYEGVALGRYIRVDAENIRGDAADIIFYNTTLDDFYSLWYNYFDMGHDYTAIGESFISDPVLYRAYKLCSGIRILRQEPFECLISFIISQNNNIPRIKKIINSLCAGLGESFEFERRQWFKFPSPRALAAAERTILDAAKSGFREKYILDAAKKISGRQIDLSLPASMNTKAAADYLMQINGVGPKVADCTLLFAYARFDAFPIDVWLKRIIAKYYAAKPFSPAVFGSFPGIAQQYLFHYERSFAKD